MKNNALFILFIGVLFTSSCCKKKVGLSIAAVRVEYPSLSGSVLLYDIQVDRSDFSKVIDSTEVYLSESNKHTYVLQKTENENNHILVMADSTFVDTLSGIVYNRDKCDVVENVGYKQNGVYKTDTEIFIQ